MAMLVTCEFLTRGWLRSCDAHYSGRHSAFGEQYVDEHTAGVVGTTPAIVSYDGLSGDIGVYQINVVVPPVGNNDAVPLTFNLGGVPASQTLYIAVHE
jgi:uncharacterized protein (TIGR03437 family)